MDIGRKGAYAAVYIAAGSNYAWTTNLAAATFGNRESDSFPFALPLWDGSHRRSALLIREPRARFRLASRAKHILAAKLFAMPDAVDSIITDALAGAKKLNQIIMLEAVERNGLK